MTLYRWLFGSILNLGPVVSHCLKSCVIEYYKHQTNYLPKVQY